MMAAHPKDPSDPGVPEGFTLSMALLDCVPVLFFSISAEILAVRFKSPLFGIGVVMVILAGAMKASWKFVLALRKRNLPFLNRQLRFLMPVGFSLAFLSLFVDRDLWSAAEVVRHMTSLPSAVFFLAGAAGILTLLWFVRHLNHSDADANWKEQMVNGITQLCILLGILF